MSADQLVREQSLWFIDNLAQVRVTGGETRGAYGVTELLSPQGSMPPLHVHHRDDEMFFVLEGELRLFAGDREITLRAGEAFVAPRGTPHTYRVVSAQVRYLIVGAPAGFEQFVLAASDAAATEGLPPADALPDPGMLAAVAAEHGIEILGPPGMVPTEL